MLKKVMANPPSGRRPEVAHPMSGWDQARGQWDQRKNNKIKSLEAKNEEMQRTVAHGPKSQEERHRIGPAPGPGRAVMRIVGGKFRGRSLKPPASHHIRPTTDRTREALFNILAHGYAGALDGARVLDLFAGTGAVGFEALSRGAEFVLFVEQSTEGRALLRANMEMLGVHGQCKLFRRDATAMGPAGTMQPFQLVFADPPYGKGLGERALHGMAAGGWLSPEALVILEEQNGVAPRLPDSFQPLERRDFGDTAMHFFRFAATAD